MLGSGGSSRKITCGTKWPDPRHVSWGMHAGGHSPRPLTGGWWCFVVHCNTVTSSEVICPGASPLPFTNGNTSFLPDLLVPPALHSSQLNRHIDQRLYGPSTQTSLSQSPVPRLALPPGSWGSLALCLHLRNGNMICMSSPPQLTVCTEGLVRAQPRSVPAATAGSRQQYNY